MAPRAGVRPGPVAASGGRALQSKMGPAEPQQLIVVSCYTQFDNLAHGPRGKEARRSLYTFRMDPEDGQMVLLSTSTEPVMNPAFSRFHPEKNLLYTCTESVAEPGEIVTWKVCPHSGSLEQVASISAEGTSTCYLTLDKDCENMLVVNYWNATVGVFGMDPEVGHVAFMRSLYDPSEGKKMQAQHDRHVNHSENDERAQRERQSDPHSHAVILDARYTGRVAYVPDLGMDIIRQLRYDPVEGRLLPAGTIRSGPEDRAALGPRYLEFHPKFPVVYAVNELASEISVFAFDEVAARALVETEAAEDLSGARPTLRLIQTISTIPEGFAGDMNTCGRVAVHASGNFVLVSNRGHDSITVFRVHHNVRRTAGTLSLASMQHTRGATPRHFQFDASGQWLITANQDSNRVSVFQFNSATGRLTWTGHEYEVPSPNFVCSVQPHPEVAVAAELQDQKLLAMVEAGEEAPLALAGVAGQRGALPSPPKSRL